MDDESKKARIMVIDDTVENLNLLNELLTEHGYQTAVFPKAELAFNSLKVSHPDLILLDINMPGMNGFEFCDKVKACDDLKEIPIIFLSALHEVDDKLKAFRAGGIDYITKPFQFDEVLIRVQTHVKLQDQKAKLEEANRQLWELEQSLERLVEKRTEQLSISNAELQKSQQELNILNKELEERVEQRTIELKESNKALEESLDKLKEDEEAGKSMQLKMMPKKKSELAGYKFKYYLRPSLYMSGDFLDYFDIDENYAVFYFSDVSGHGAASAFITFMLKSFVDNCKNNYLQNHDDIVISPAKLLKKFNNVLVEESLEKYITMFYGVLKKKENKLLYGNGGHFPFPYICSDNKVRPLSGDTKFPPVGLFDFSDYKHTEIDLPEEFDILVFSDGVLDILPERDVDKQLKKLEDIALALSKSFGNIKNTLYPLEQGDLLDDITILSVKRERNK
jgi:DNA-binding response OmpR family regulator